MCLFIGAKHRYESKLYACCLASCSILIGRRSMSLQDHASFPPAANNSTRLLHVMPKQGNPVPILYFALHCGNPTNKLSYTPLSLISQVRSTT